MPERRVTIKTFAALAPEADPLDRVAQFLEELRQSPIADHVQDARGGKDALALAMGEVDGGSEVRVAAPCAPCPLSPPDSTPSPTTARSRRW